MVATIHVTFDCADPARLASFWAEALGYQLRPPPDGFASWEDWLRDQQVPEAAWNSRSAVVDPSGAGPRLLFMQVPEPKAGKNRVHLDVSVGGGHDTPVEQRRERVAATVERLVVAGGTRLRAVDEHDEHWVVMADPEGNEFCVT